jgi:hypothetical protein
MRRPKKLAGAWVACLFAACGAAPIPAPGTDRLVIRDVTVIDATGAPPRVGMTVTLEGGRITSVDSAGRAKLTEGVSIDGTGLYLIPGLWDMHVHASWDRRNTIPLMLVNGVTGLREMFGKDVGAIRRVRDEVGSGALAGPRIVFAGPIIDGPDAVWPGSIEVRSPDDAAHAVSLVRTTGADFVKVYSSLSRESYFAIAGEATRLGIPFAGHLPAGISLVEASNAGQQSVEHLAGVAVLDSLDGAGVDSVFAVLRRNRTWQTPTLTVLRVAANPSDSALIHNPNARYAPLALRGLWGLVRRMVPGDTSPAQAAERARRFSRRLEVVGQMYRAGVPILAGTDSPNPYTIPGFSLHDELSLLVEAGLTPMAALQSATRDAARFLHIEDSCGSIEVGKAADLVLLRANPLSDIRNTRSIQAVIVGGRYLPRAALDRMLEQVEGGRWHPGEAALILGHAILRSIPWFVFPIMLGLLGILAALVVRLIRWSRRRTAPAGPWTPA